MDVDSFRKHVVVIFAGPGAVEMLKDLVIVIDFNPVHHMADQHVYQSENAAHFSEATFLLENSTACLDEEVALIVGLVSIESFHKVLL